MNKQYTFWFYLGITAFSGVIGILIGASHSPVVGVFITGVLGLIIGLAGLIYGKGGRPENKSIGVNAIGITLFIFSVFLIVGVYAGMTYRLNYVKKKMVEFLWENDNRKPQSVYEALDWILVSEILSEKGFTKGQIEELYQWSDSSNLKYDKDYPYYKVLLQNSAVTDKFDYPLMEYEKPIWPE